MQEIQVTQEDYQQLESLAKEDADPAQILPLVKQKIPPKLRPVVKLLPVEDLADIVLSEIPPESFLKTARGKRWITQGLQALQASF